jgi:tRNA modification GTPase
MSARLARLTPSGRSAIAVLSLRGHDAWRILTSAFRRRNTNPLPNVPSPDSMYLGWLGKGKASDEVVVRVVSPEEIEIHGHGGPEAVALVEETLVRQGVRLVPWSDLEEHEPAWRREAIEVLMQCTTLRTAGIALDQWHGAFQRAVAEIQEARRVGQHGLAEERLQRLRAMSSVGDHLVRPWKVVIAGAPNVGKSSLINAIAGYQRSVVSPIAGTTRDVVTCQVALDGWSVVLTDTAGLRASDDWLEATGIARAQQSLANADLVVWVIDATEDGSPPPSVPPHSIIVANKIDLASRSFPSDWIAVSARTGAHLDQLVARIAAQLVPSPPTAAEAVPLPAWTGMLAAL